MLAHQPVSLHEYVWMRCTLCCHAMCAHACAHSRTRQQLQCAEQQQSRQTLRLLCALHASFWPRLTQSAPPASAFLQLCNSLLAAACLSSASSPVLSHHEQQYYFETIFPRIPKKVEDEIQAGLRSRGLPTKGRGNGGCGGADRRGGDDGNRRPASVKASLSVAFGQRAPNRAGTKDTARFKAAEAAVGAGGGRGGSSRSRSRSREAPRRGGGATPERQPQRERREYDYDSRDRQRDGDSR
jgi:hypothetical protein